MNVIQLGQVSKVYRSFLPHILRFDLQQTFLYKQHQTRWRALNLVYYAVINRAQHEKCMLPNQSILPDRIFACSVFQADFTPLMFAAYHGHHKVVQVLLEANCELNAVGTVSRVFYAFFFSLLGTGTSIDHSFEKEYFKISSCNFSYG